MKTFQKAFIYFLNKKPAIIEYDRKKSAGIQRAYH